MPVLLNKIKTIDNQIGRCCVSAFGADSPKGTPSLALPKSAAKTALLPRNMTHGLGFASPLLALKSIFISPVSEVTAVMLVLCNGVRYRSIFRSRIDTTKPHKIAVPIRDSVLVRLYISGCNPLTILLLQIHMTA